MLVIAKVFNGLMLPPKPEVVNRTEHDSISVHVYTIPREYGGFLCHPGKHKTNDSCETLRSEKVMNSSLNNQSSLLVNTIASSSKQQLLGSWYHPKLPSDKVAHMVNVSSTVRHLLQSRIS
jgi:hypothetical protein